jgi:hypothetical protein
MISWFLRGLVVVILAPVAALGQGIRCSQTRAATGKAFTIDVVEQLAGNYRVTLLDSTGTLREPGKIDLVLWVSDSVRRFRYVTSTIGYIRGERPLWGTARGRSAEWIGGAAWSQPEGESWSVAFVQGALQIGTIDGNDGWSHYFDITAYRQDGFGGRWHSDYGFEVIVDRAGRQLPNPAGVFCAERTGPFRDAPLRPRQ